MSSDPPPRKTSLWNNRKIHRWLGFAAAILFLYVSATGVILQYKQLFGAEEQEKEAMAAIRSPVSLMHPLQLAPTTLERARQAVLLRFGDRPVDSIEWQIKGPSPHLTFHLGGRDPLRVDVEADGRITSVASDEEDFFIRLHSGEIIGDGGKVLGLGWGLGLMLMSFTGFLVWLQMYRSRQKKERTRRKGLGRWFWSVAGVGLLFGAAARPVRADTPEGWSYDPDAGLIYKAGDFRRNSWGYAERVIDPDGPDYFRRVRQGMEFDLPRVSDAIRPAFVYEVDLTDTNAFGINPGPAGRLNYHDFENLFFAFQNPDDPGKFRVLIGENTHILSREDNLSSGNLPTINRSLVLEEHGSVRSFGTQFGIEFQKALSDKLTLQLAALDNRGSFNTDRPRYHIGNALSGKLIYTPISTETRKLTVGAAVDRTGHIGDREFTLATAIGAEPLGAVPTSGTKLTFEGDAAYTFPLLRRPTTIEAEALRSSFSGSNSEVFGGYGMAQFSLFDSRQTGDLDLFLRYDLVSLGQERIAGRARQRALRVGFNYNLPYANKLVSLHVEYAHNSLRGPTAIVTDSNPPDEFRVELRASLQRYLRH
ncbi:MAG: PepSY domain-containing protein [Pseudomonadota bacterium]